MQQKIEEFVRARAESVRDTHGIDIEHLLRPSIGRIAFLEIEKAEGTKNTLLRNLLHYEFDHVVDWLVAAVVNGAPWLSRVNADGVPLKIAKFGTFQQIVNEANKAMLKNITRGITGGKGGEVVHSFHDGWTVVRLTSNEELDRESAQMQHCVGHGAYDEAVRSGRKTIHSLRDPAGNSHVTVEMATGSVGNIVEQVKGKQNRQPRRDYFEKVAEWLETLGSYQFACDEYPSGWAVTRQFRLVELMKLPAGSTFHGDVSISFLDAVDDDNQDERDAPLALPEGLTILGKLDVRGMWKHRVVFPPDLKVIGDLYINGMTVDVDRLSGKAVYLEDCYVRTLPTEIAQAVSIARATFDEDFKDGRPVAFGGFASISNSNIETALDRMSFGGDLNLDIINGWIGCEEHPCFTVGGDLRISRSRIKFFQDVRIGGSMVLNQTDIDWEPKSVHVGKDLRLHRSGVKTLPDDLVIGGSLEVSSCHGLKYLPQRAKVGGNTILTDTSMSLGSRRNFAGDLVLSRYGAKRLQDNLRIAGDMTVSDCDFENLPAGLDIGGTLSVKGGIKLRNLPSDMRIGKGLVIENSHIKTIPKGMFIPGDLDIRGSLAFTLPNGVVIGGALISERAGLTELPYDLKVRHLLASDSFLEALPDDFSIEGDLDISKTVVCELPHNLRVGGDADFRESEIAFIPASVEIGGAINVDEGVVVGSTVAHTPGRTVEMR